MLILLQKQKIIVTIVENYFNNFFSLANLNKAIKKVNFRNNILKISYLIKIKIFNNNDLDF